MGEGTVREPVNTTEWQKMCAWVKEHWPKGWPLEHQVTWYTDLEDFDDSDVWSAIHHLYEEGRDFPPNGSVLLNRCIYERQQTARADMYRGLPETVGAPMSTTWEAYTKQRFGEVMSVEATIVRIHRDRPCLTETCDIHFPKRLDVSATVV